MGLFGKNKDTAEKESIIQKLSQENLRYKTILEQIQNLAGKEVRLSKVDLLYQDMISIFNLTVTALGGAHLSIINEQPAVVSTSAHDVDEDDEEGDES